MVFRHSHNQLISNIRVNSLIQNSHKIGFLGLVVGTAGRVVIVATGPALAVAVPAVVVLGLLPAVPFLHHLPKGLDSSGQS